MVYKYKLVTETVYNSDIGYFETAGIEVMLDDGEGETCIDFQSDVSVDVEAVKMMVDLMNRVQMLPINFHKAIEDVFYS